MISNILMHRRFAENYCKFQDTAALQVVAILCETELTVNVSSVQKEKEISILEVIFMNYSFYVSC